MRWAFATVVFVVAARQGLLAFSASMSLTLSDGLVDLFEGDQASVPRTLINTNCDTDAAAPHALGIHLDGSSDTSTCNEYRSYPEPESHSGLPFLADVFATRDREFLFFIGLNRGLCQNEFKDQDAWRLGENRFMCVFPGNTMVISEFVAPTGATFKNNFMFKCAIPEEFQHLVVPGQESTNLHIDLHALNNPEGPQTGMNKVRWFPSQKITDTPKIEQIPVCHAGYANLEKQYELVTYTRVKSTYTTQIDKDGNTWERSSIHRIEEWIDWHVFQGFDHFIIYDNDEKPHGPIEKLTKPLVESGLVTYRWFPLKDCMTQAGKYEGWIRRIGQAAGGLAAMHRLGEEGAKFFAHMDVDEFFVIFGEDKTVLEYTESMLGSPESPYDVLGFDPTVMDHCKGVTVKSEADSSLETKQCFTDSHASDKKLIMKSDRMLHFQVHFPLTTKNWTKPNEFTIPRRETGYLAHYRGEMEPGLKDTKWKPKDRRVDYFDDFLAQRKKKQTS